MAMVILFFANPAKSEMRSCDRAKMRLATSAETYSEQCKDSLGDSHFMPVVTLRCLRILQFRKWDRAAERENAIGHVYRNLA